MNYKKALKYATKMHETTPLRVGGEKYITHPIAVAENLRKKGFDTDVQIMGLFHDLLEDTPATKAEIIALSNQNVYDVVVLLTKEKDYNMDEYISSIEENSEATAVKLADRIHNLESSIIADDKFRMKYYKESTEYYNKLVENSSKENKNLFLSDFNEAMSQLQQTLVKRVKVMGYGSLMNTADFMRMFDPEEQKSIIKIGNGILKGHKLAYTYNSKMRKGGVLDVIKGCEDDYVIGVVNDMPYHLMTREIDTREVHPTLYKRELINVTIDGNLVEVYCYFVLEHIRDYNEIAPHEDYRDIVLTGMFENNFPKEYIQKHSKHVKSIK